MKKIIMMVLVAATALSGITVSTRKAEALVIENYDSNNHEENTKRIMELLGLEFSPTYSGEDYQAYLKSTLVARHDYNSKTYEIRYLADKDGKVIIDDRPMCIKPEPEINTNGMRVNTSVDSRSYDILEGFSWQFKCFTNGIAEKSNYYTYNEPVGVSWSSDTPDIADVDENGVITAKKPGKAVIRVKTLDSGRELTYEINVIRNQQKGVKRPWLVNGKREKIRADYVISYDKNGKAILKFTVKNMSKKKYKKVLWISIYDRRAKETFPDALGKVCLYKRKCTLKPGKSKTFKIDIKKLSKLSKSGWYMDLDRAASVDIFL